MPDAEVDALAKEVVDWYIEWNPIFATYVGIHDHDHRLPIGTYDAELEERARVKEFLRRVEAIDRTGLSAGKRVDLGNLRNVFRVLIFESEEIGTWQSMPRGAQTVGDALFPLFMRSFAPLPRRLDSITGRRERSPGFLEETKGRIRTPVKIWCEISLEVAQRAPGFLHVIEATGKEALVGPDRARLEEAVAKTGAALQDYAKWIGSDVLPRSKAKVGIGAAKFRKLVRLRELGLTVDEIYAVGKKYLRESKRALVRVAKEIKPGASVEEAKEIVKSDHPARFEEALAYTAKAMSDSKAFIRQHDLATIPPNEERTAIETRSYMRHVIPFAAYNAPARFEAHKQGFYMVTPVEDKPEMLREHSFPGVRNTAVHEGYPGHHLQLTCASLNPSYARILADATETIEGRAHYCEDMMKEAGFSSDPKTKLVQLLDQIWRACRILIDVDLHSGKMTFDEAVDLHGREEGHGVQGERPLREGDRGRVAPVPRDRHLAFDSRDQGRRGAERREDRLAVRWGVREPHRVHGRGDVGHRPRGTRETANGCGLDRRRRDQRDSSGGFDQRGAGERAHRLPAQRGTARQRRRVFLELRLSPGQESSNRRRRRLDGRHDQGRDRGRPRVRRHRRLGGRPREQDGPRRTRGRAAARPDSRTVDLKCARQSPSAHRGLGTNRNS